jgi:hypothetical protein
VGVDLSQRLVPDGLWELVAPLLPSFNSRPQGGGTAPCDERAVYRHQRSRSIPYERGVRGELSAATKSLRYTATASTGLPRGSSIWYGSQRSPVSNNWPT